MNNRKKLARYAAIVISSMLVFLFQGAFAASVNISSSKNENISTRIINGVTAKSGAWPWMAAILSREEQDNFFAQFCGGSLIHPQWVLTAAHCFFQEDGLRGDGNGTDVLIGTNSLSSGGQRINVDQTIIHSGYNPNDTSSEYDIALLHLATPVNNVQPISLPGRSFDVPVVADNANSTVIGWGNLSAAEGGNEFPTELMQVDLPIVSETQCKLWMGADEITSNMLCAGFIQGGKDSCQGDSGGPLISSIGGINQLLGIVSWGTGCALPENPGVYTRVSKFEPFITNHICASDKPATPSLTVTSTLNQNGYYTVTINISEVSASKYRLYYAPFVEAGNPITQIRHIETGNTGQYVLPPGSKFYVATQAVNNNCSSGFSNIAVAPNI